ncbi:hypothetical protein ACH5RR_000907 [Cinchona calisaya]|uniref:Uncharacterized protein n=1 Tax=Cinchona calisaya TaxID=153742 RepID=A0ABD3B248_9GENT
MQSDKNVIESANRTSSNSNSFFNLDVSLREVFVVTENTDMLLASQNDVFLTSMRFYRHLTDEEHDYKGKGFGEDMSNALSLVQDRRSAIPVEKPEEEYQE